MSIQTNSPKYEVTCNFPPKYVVVHPNLDLDALCCIIAYPDRTPYFLPANAKEIPEHVKHHDHIVLDHPLGNKGRLDDDGTRHAALLSIDNVNDWNPDLLAEVDEQDSTGKVDNPHFTLFQLLEAARTYFLDYFRRFDTKDRTKYVDKLLIETFTPIIKGLNMVHKSKDKVRQYIKENIPIIQTSFGKIAIVDNHNMPGMNMILNKEYDVSCTIYHNGNNIGIVRFPDRNEPDLRLLADHLPGWFIHTRGFVAAWGTRKAPKATNPPDGTPQNSNELYLLVSRVLDVK